MQRQHIHTAPETLTTSPRVIEYADLLDAVQLSVSRLIHLPGAMEAHSFTEVMSRYDDFERRRIDNEVGARFDQELINFVRCAMIGQRRPLIIRAEQQEGLDGHLPWEEPLQTHLASLREKSTIKIAPVIIERYKSADHDQNVAILTEQAKLFAA